MKPVIEIRNLTTEFRLRGGTLPAVMGMDLTVYPKETLALVGESGSGKSVTALSILKLLPKDKTNIRADKIAVAGCDVLTATGRELCELRGGRAAMVFQDPMTSLNPVFPIGRQIIEALEAHQVAKGRKARELAISFLEKVRIPDAARRMDDYPHQLSGGMNQRVVIAIAIACNPEFLIADEPTTALDVTIQAQILRLLSELQSELGMGMLLITHDLGVVARNAHRVAVMYAGRKVEEGPVKDVFRHPMHPYTAGLLAATPQPTSEGRLAEIPGMVPSLHEMPAGCAFAPRCARATDICRQSLPPLFAQGDRQVACFNQLGAT